MGNANTRFTIWSAINGRHFRNGGRASLLLSYSHKIVAYWGKGSQMNSPVDRDPFAGVAFRGRSYRLNGTPTRPAHHGHQDQDHNQRPNHQANDNGGVFRGRSYRLSGN
uniref:Uncharacterized protein n=1 Tax=Cannabis sativa TaxID=3483 RepID=A0A803NSN5_CANSA